MKTKVILGSLLALSGIMNAQTWGGSGSTTGDTYRSGNVGIGSGMTSPNYALDITGSVTNDGIQVTMPVTGTGAASLWLNNLNTGGHLYQIGSNGIANSQGVGNFSIFDYTNAAAGGPGTRFLIKGSTGNVGIGNINPINARLDVKEDGATTFNRGIYATALRTSGGANWNAGLEARGGVIGDCGGSSYGVIGRGYNATNCYGGYFSTHDDQSCNPSISVGVFATGITHAGYFSGNLEYTGTLTGPSDRKLKENIQPLVNALDKIKLLKPSIYNYRVNEFRDMRLPQGLQMGLIAQELEQVFPELVKTSHELNSKDENGNLAIQIPEHKTVNYINLIPVLISGIQEQQNIIESQQKQIDALHQKLSSSTGINDLNTVSNGFQMSQNEPNPFTHETVVKYTLPTTTSNAFMVVYDLTGKQITTFPINERGSASVVLTSDKLSAGIYIYSIVADGKVVDSKRMIVSEK